METPLCDGIQMRAMGAVRLHTGDADFPHRVVARVGVKAVRNRNILFSMWTSSDSVESELAETLCARAAELGADDVDEVTFAKRRQLRKVSYKLSGVAVARLEPVPDH